MRFSAILILAPILALAAPGPERGEGPNLRDGAEVLDERGDGPLALRGEDLGLDKRACKYNGCKCASGYVGVYCANCLTKSGNWVVGTLGSGGAEDHVYQCNGASSCCDYGYAAKCKNGAAGRCGT